LDKTNESHVTPARTKQSKLFTTEQRKKEKEKYNFEPRLNEKESREERAQGFKDLQARMQLGALRKALTPDAVRRLVTESRRNILKPLPHPYYLASSILI